MSRIRPNHQVVRSIECGSRAAAGAVHDDDPVANECARRRAPLSGDGGGPAAGGVLGPVPAGEQNLAVPRPRVPGGRGHAVFAYVSEIDAWLKANPPAHLATANGNGEDKPNGSRAPAGEGAFPAGG